MGKPHKQEEFTGQDLDEEEDESENISPPDLPPDLGEGDDYIDDWINHVDDFDNSDGLNNW